MPIEIHVVTEQEFNDWVEESKIKYAAKNNLIANKK
jgi:heme/copper-type cytochrome/quinol oxidase subunit 2